MWITCFDMFWYVSMPYVAMLISERSRFHLAPLGLSWSLWRAAQRFESSQCEGGVEEQLCQLPFSHLNLTVYYGSHGPFCLMVYLLKIKWWFSTLNCQRVMILWMEEIVHQLVNCLSCFTVADSYQLMQDFFHPRYYVTIPLPALCCNQAGWSTSLGAFGARTKDDLGVGTLRCTVAIVLWAPQES